MHGVLSGLVKRRPVGPEWREMKTGLGPVVTLSYASSGRNLATFFEISRTYTVVAGFAMGNRVSWVVGGLFGAWRDDWRTGILCDRIPAVSGDGGER